MHVRSWTKNTGAQGEINMFQVPSSGITFAIPSLMSPDVTSLARETSTYDPSPTSVYSRVLSHSGIFSSLGFTPS